MATLFSVRTSARASVARALTRLGSFLAVAALILAAGTPLALADSQQPADEPKVEAAEAVTLPEGKLPPAEEAKPVPETPAPTPPATDPPVTGSDDDDGDDGNNGNNDGNNGNNDDGNNGNNGNGNNGNGNGNGGDDEGEGDEEQPSQGGTANPGTSEQSKPADTQSSNSAPAVPTTPAVALPLAQAQTPSDNSSGRSERSPRRSQRRTGRNGGANVGGNSSPSSGPGSAGGVAGAGGDAAAGVTAGAAAPPNSSGNDAGRAARDEAARRKSDEGSAVTRTVTRTVRDIVEVVPDSAKVALALLASLAVLLGTGYMLSAVRGRRLARQRHDLLQEVGLLQAALLPAVPATLGALRTSVAYRPAEGVGAGGDFYDVLPLSGGRVGFILGDISGHGHAALERTAFMRYTLRAYLEAGLEPRMALQVAGRVIEDSLGGDFATVVIAVHDPESGSLTYASAGHPAPIVTGAEPHEPVTAASSPPIGVGVRTGLRQTTVPLEPGAVACLFTDGLTEARTEDGILGRWRLHHIVEKLGRDADAQTLLDRVAEEARVTSDDMATCLITPTSGAIAGGFRTEQLELSERELDGPLAARFLEACGLPEAEVARAESEARAAARQFGGVVMHVVLGNRSRVEVLPRNVESIEAASRRVAAAR